MTNECELVIRWLNEPVEAACALCKSKKPKKFEKGPVVSQISGELICPTCAYKYDKNLWSVWSMYTCDPLGRNHKMNMDDLKCKFGDLDDFIKNPKADLDLFPAISMDDGLKLNLGALDDSLPDFKIDGLDKCSKCTHKFQLKGDSKSSKSE